MAASTPTTTCKTTIAKGAIADDGENAQRHVIQSKGSEYDEGICWECGQMFGKYDLTLARCHKCDQEKNVCRLHTGMTSCLECSTTELCGVCGVKRKPIHLTDVVCFSCEKQIKVCEVDVFDVWCVECQRKF